MLDRLFSSPQRHKRYAIAVSVSIASYLFAGFLAVKWLFLGEAIIPSVGTIILIMFGTGVFAAIHNASMRQLDQPSQRPESRPPSAEA